MRSRGGFIPARRRVREWMTAEPMTVTTGTALEEAGLVMSEYGFHHLPVVDADGRPLGMVGLRDTVRPSAAPGPRVHIGLGL